MKVGLGELVVVKFMFMGKLDLGSSFATIASSCDTEENIRPHPQRRWEMCVLAPLVIIQALPNVAPSCQGPRRFGADPGARLKLGLGLHTGAHSERHDPLEFVSIIQTNG